jgi:hypothetical protein
MSSLESIKDREKRITLLRQNLTIFKNAVRRTRSITEETFNRAEIGLTQDYIYRDIVEKQIDAYKNAKKLADESINSENWYTHNEVANGEKNKLAECLKTYERVRDVEALEISNNAILDEENARQFMLNCMADLIGELIELSGDKSEFVIEEAKSLLNDVSVSITSVDDIRANDIHVNNDDE